MKREYVFLVTGLLGSLLLAGCYQITRAQVMPESIKNPSFGRYGYELKLPPGFTALETNQMMAAQVPFAQLLLELQFDQDKRWSGSRTFIPIESYGIQHTQMGFLFGAVKTMVFLNRLTPLQRRERLEQISFFSFTNVPKEDRKYWDHQGKSISSVTYVEKLTATDKREVPVVFMRVFIMGKYNDCYTINGAAPAQQKAALEAATKQLVESLEL